MKIRTDQTTIRWALFFRLSLLAFFTFFLSFVTFAHTENTILSISRQIPYAGLTVLLVFLSFSESFSLNAILIVLDILMQVIFRNAENEYLALRSLQQHNLS